MCDCYPDKPTIKDLEYATQAGGENETSFTITGPEQKRPKEFQSLLDTGKYKKSLLNFLAEEWQKPIYSNIIGECHLYIGLQDKAWLYKVHGDVIIRVEVPQLECQHEEADTRIM